MTRKFPKGVLEALRRAWREGTTLTELSARFGASRDTIKDRVKDIELPQEIVERKEMRRSAKRGRRVHKGTLRAIRRAWKEGMTLRELSVSFGIPQSTLLDWVKDVEIPQEVAERKRIHKYFTCSLAQRKRYEKEGRYILNDQGHRSHKRCNLCDKMKTITNFSFDVYHQKHRNLCKPCNSQYMMSLLCRT